MFGFFATFLKKGSAKNFTDGKVLAHIVRSNILPRVILSVGMWYNIFNKKANDKMTVKERDIMPKGERKEYLNS